MYNGLVDYVIVAIFLEVYRVVFSVALHTGRQFVNKTF